MKERNAVVVVFGFAIIFVAVSAIFLGLYVSDLNKKFSQTVLLLEQEKIKRDQSEKLNQELNLNIGTLWNQMDQFGAEITRLKNQQENGNLDDNYRQRICAEADYLVYLEVESVYKNTAQRGWLSGFIIEYNGQQHVLAMTAGHIRSDDETITKITVLFRHSAETQEAEILGYDSVLDVALLKFKNPNFVFTGKPAKLGNSSELKVGDEIIVLGAPLGFKWTATFGEVINLEVGNAYGYEEWGFEQERLIMHSALTNPGNSGGPVLNNRGEVVGIHVMSIKSRVLRNFTIDFITHIPLAIPIDDVKKILDELANGMQK